MAKNILHSFFTTQLIYWNSTYNMRKMPWKGQKDPYKIWLSEIILQQTRVEQGWEYYHKFLTHFPNITDLANAPETKVFKLWEGLGYYTRCRNLIATAKFIAEERNGTFPGNFKELLALKGVGPYTAAAIASFAYNLPHAVVDGNVYRVLARFFGIETAIDSTAGKKFFNHLAQELLDESQPGAFNQAIMDFGATVCKPQNPDCKACLLQHKCIAFKKNKIKELPVKEKSIQKQHRYFNYLVIIYNKKIYINKRTKKDIWHNLYEFILLETEDGISKNEEAWRQFFMDKMDIGDFRMMNISKKYKQQLTHQTIEAHFIKIRLEQPLPKLAGKYELVPVEDLNSLPFPKLINTYLADIYNELF